jgi:hypothetical protein
MRTGSDNLGVYREFTFRYTSNGARAGGIRIYAEKPVVLFSVTYLEAAPNTARFRWRESHSPTRYRSAGRRSF